MSNKLIKTAGNRGLFMDGVLVMLPSRCGALRSQHGMFSRPFTVKVV
jgi:hypothetical protein